MDKQKLKELLNTLKHLVNELESEVYSDPRSYTEGVVTLNLDYGEVLKYYQTNDDDGEPD